MYIHVKFADGSNPWLSFNLTKKQTIKKVNYFQKKYRDQIYIAINEIETNKELLQDFNGCWFVRYDNKAKTYKRLGDALNFLLKEDKKQ